MRTSEMDVDSSSKFIASLTKFLQSLCNGYVDFENGVELVGHIYLSVDTGKKIDYILHEKVCKNDENSVTFISNSFHAQPFDKTKSQTKQQVDTFKGKTRSDKVRDVDKEETVGRKDDDEDVVIVNATKGALENSDGASMGTRGRKRPASPSSEQQFQRPFRRNAEGSLSSPSSSAQQSGQSGSGVLGSNGLRRKAQPSATITSQEDQTDSFSSSDLKLEHMTTDELLSLASQVSDSSCSASIIPPATGSGSRSTGGEPSNQQVWVKQEAPDDDDSCLASGSGDSAHGQSWPLGRDPQNDTNSGSGGLYPVMLHQNTAAFPGPGGPFPAGFPPLSGGPSSSQHPAFTQQSSSQAAANLFASPVPGTSQGGGAVDSAVTMSMPPCYGNPYAARPSPARAVSTERCRRYRERLRHNPYQYFAFLQRQRLACKRYREKKKQLKDRADQQWRQHHSYGTSGEALWAEVERPCRETRKVVVDTESALDLTQKNGD
ncbi:uncharacterized protein LOC112563532 isoform X6 [Pomacea canaliculata]|uniref:uncharacterized protein LOC112563532 isoform X6 n=1 Tax=Pomacea canaliculata TaxID=400727 RepID=UPI000D73F52B|nr:uncharacterized protein LOC112563532 isoform X6 [Pomacea canaliculata]